MTTFAPLGLGSTPIFFSNTLSAGEGSDVFTFDVAGDTTSINVGLRSAIPSGRTRLSLREDTNRNGVLDSGDRSIGNIGGASNDAMVHARATGANRYFAQITNLDGLVFNYNLRATASKPSNIFDPSPFEQLGSIQFDTAKNRDVNNGQTTDVFAFSLNSTSGVNISLVNFDADVDMRLIRDFNGNGVVDSGEEIARSALGGTSTDRINNITGTGAYILQVYQFAPGTFLRYDANFDHFVTNAAGPANSRAEQEVRVGNISDDLTRRGVVNQADPGDSFGFSLDPGQTIGIRLKELSGDSYMRVVQDLNSDGKIQKREVLQTSVGSGSLEQISSLTGAGDYIAQIWQVGNESARYKLTFDAAPTQNAPGVSPKA